jgi:hypothetical protein
MTRSLTALLVLATAAACAGEPEQAPPPADEAPAVDAAATTPEPACWLMQATPAEAAQRASPRDSASVQVAGGTLKVCYGGPSARGRTIIGGLDAYGEPWRMGADEATALHVTIPVEVGGVRLEPGAYSLFGIPDPQTWTVVLNRQAERWGIPISPEVRADDVGQFTVPTETMAEHVETLRYRFEPQGEGRADLLMEFETTRVRMPVQAAGG